MAIKITGMDISFIGIKHEMPGNQLCLAFGVTGKTMNTILNNGEIVKDPAMGMLARIYIRYPELLGEIPAAAEFYKNLTAAGVEIGEREFALTLGREISAAQRWFPRKGESLTPGRSGRNIDLILHLALRVRGGNYRDAWDLVCGISNEEAESRSVSPIGSKTWLKKGG